MTPSKERARLEASSRKRLIAWRDMQKSICDYAAVVAQPHQNVRFNEGHDGWGIRLAGNKHVERVRLNLASCFDKLLPFLSITVGGKKKPFTSKSIYDSFQTDMLAAGIDITASYCPVISVDHVAKCIATFRLTGARVEFPSYQAFKMKRILQRRERDWKRVQKAEMADYQARKVWKCPICGHLMTEEESKGYRGCPSGFHFAQHVPAK